MPSDYKIITTKKELVNLTDACRDTGYASIDFETNGQPFYHPASYPTVLGVSYQPGQGVIIPLGHKDSPFKRNFKDHLRFFGNRVIENKEVNKIAWNTQFEYCWFEKYGITMRGSVDDAMLAKYMLDEERPMGLKDMVTRYLPEFSGYDLKGQPSSKSDPQRIAHFWSNVELEELSKYCALDCDLTFRLMIFFYTKLRYHKLYKLYRNMLMMGVRVLSESKIRGIDVDKDFLDVLDVKYLGKINTLDKDMRSINKIGKFEKHLIQSKIDKAIDKVEQEILDLEEEVAKVKKDSKKLPKEEKNIVRAKAKQRAQRLIESREKKIDKLQAREMTSQKDLKLLEPINFNSPDQLKDLFFTKKGFKLKPVDFTDTGAPSTDEASLLVLQKKDKTGFIEKLLELRGLTKLHSTYIKGIREKLSPDSKIHADFLLHGTVTGRLSSRGPNLQNIPRACVSYETEILSDKGWLTIGDLVPPEIGTYENTTPLRLLTHKGEFKNVTHFVNKGKEEMFKVTFDNGTSIKCTLSHKFLTDKNGWKSLKEIIDNDYECRSFKTEGGRFT